MDIKVDTAVFFLFGLIYGHEMFSLSGLLNGHTLLTFLDLRMDTDVSWY